MRRDKIRWNAMGEVAASCQAMSGKYKAYKSACVGQNVTVTEGLYLGAVVCLSLRLTALNIYTFKKRHKHQDMF